MKNKLLVVILAIVVACSAVICWSWLARTSGTVDGSKPVVRLSGSEISQTPLDITIRFEAVAVMGLGGNCLELFTPEDLKAYGADPKWAIASTFGFEPSLWDRIPGTRPAIVTGKYIFVRDRQNGPCGIVTGTLFEISGIEYL
jgi:hypothetical protein